MNTNEQPCVLRDQQALSTTSFLPRFRLMLQAWQEIERDCINLPGVTYTGPLSSEELAQAFLSGKISGIRRSRRV